MLMCHRQSEKATADQTMRQAPASPDAFVPKTAMAGGLLNLVEAATALYQLGESVPGTTHCISEDEHSDTQSAMSSPSRTSKGRTNTKSPKKCHSKSKSTNKFKKVAPKKTGSTSGSNAKDGQAIANREAFPRRLMRMLSDPSVSPVITWLSHGMSFVILRPDIFAERVLPRYFPESTADARKGNIRGGGAAKYPSFTRKLNRWGFRQIARGPDAGAFHHSLFQRDAPELCDGMGCQKSRRPNTGKVSGDDKVSSTKQVVSPSPEESSGTAVSPSSSPPPSPKSLPPKKRKLHVVVSDTPAKFLAAEAAEKSNVPILPNPTIVRRVSGFSDDVSAITSASSVSSAASDETHKSLGSQQLQQSSASSQVSQMSILNALMANRIRAERDGDQQQLQKPPQQRRPSHMYEPSLHRALSPVAIQPAPQPLQPIAPSVESNKLPSNAPGVAAQVQVAEDAKSMLYKAYLQALMA